MTIGGEMELDLDSVGSGAEAADRWRALLPGRTALASTGRAALASILAALRRADPALRSFLLPSYLCGSLLRPFRDAGIDVEFFPVGEQLDLAVDELPARVKRSGAGGILFIDYFGFPARPAEREALADLKQTIWVVEDCAAGGLLEGGGALIGATGHFAFTSLRKYLPVPDGAVIWNRSGCDMAEPPPVEAPAWVRLRVLGKLLRGERRGAGAELAPRLEETFLALFAASERLLDESGGALGASRFFAQTQPPDLPAIAGARLENYTRLHERLAQDQAAGLAPLIPPTRGPCAPLVLPLLCRDAGQRDALRRHLALGRIFCPVHWALPPEVDAAAFPGSASLSRRILGLPVDQRYGVSEMDRIHRSVVEFPRGA
jgi:dTDP-4-amino-4,6-dideoxygalactose transaminase